MAKKKNRKARKKKATDLTFGERIIACKNPVELVETIEKMCRKEMVAALVDLGVCVAVQHQQERFEHVEVV